MLAQAYSNGLLRLFDKNGKSLCDIHIEPPLKSIADKRMKQLRIARRESWRDYPQANMSEAKVRFLAR
jgi:hypothetical protein